MAGHRRPPLLRRPRRRRGALPARATPPCPRRSPSTRAPAALVRRPGRPLPAARPADVAELLAAPPASDLRLVARRRRAAPTGIAAAQRCRPRTTGSRSRRSRSALPGRPRPGSADRCGRPRALSATAATSRSRAGRVRGRPGLLADDGAERGEVPHRWRRRRSVPVRGRAGGVPARLRSTAARRSSSPPGCTTPSATPSAEGFEQHGVLNVLARRRGRRWTAAGERRATILALRDPEHARCGVLDWVRRASRVRRSFRSFGCCGVTDPLGDLVGSACSERLERDDAPLGRPRPTGSPVPGASNLPYGVFVARREAPRVGVASATSARPGAPRRGRGAATAATCSSRRRSTRSWRRAGRPGRRCGLADRAARAEALPRPRGAPPAPAGRRHAAAAVRGRRLRRLLLLAAPRRERRPRSSGPTREACTPNWKHLPIGYHGRAGTVVVSGHRRGTPERPAQAAGARTPRRTGPVGPARHRGRGRLRRRRAVAAGHAGADGGLPPSTSSASCLLNDWSARDLQAWEYVPLGPFLGKSFATSVSPWVVPLDALLAARVAAPVQDPAAAALPARGDAAGGWTSPLEVELERQVVSPAAVRRHVLDAGQQLAHLTVNGASLRTGDLFASGTVSRPGAATSAARSSSCPGTAPSRSPWPTARPARSSRTATRCRHRLAPGAGRRPDRLRRGPRPGAAGRG